MTEEKQLRQQAEESADFKIFQELCYHIGLALVTWQDVEEAHFKLFFKLIGAPNKEIASLAYHSIESFESRHKMVDRMLVLFCQKNQNTDFHLAFWKESKGSPGLYKQIKDANLNRNKLAHYTSERDVLTKEEHPDGSVTIEFGEPKLQPSSYNLVSRAIGRTPDNPEHNLDVRAIREYIKLFRELAETLDRFHSAMPVWPVKASLVRRVGMPPKWILDKLSGRPTPSAQD